MERAQGQHFILRSWLIFNFRLHLQLRRIFYRWGEIVYNHPFKIILGALLLTIICSIGLLRFSLESRATKLWVPQDSNGIKWQNFMKKTWPEEGLSRDPSIILFTAKNEGDNILTESALLQMLYVHQTVLNITFKGEDGEDLTYENTCVRPFSSSPDCAYFGGLEYWNYNETMIQESNGNYFQDVQGSIVLTRFQSPIPRSLVLGGIELDSNGEVNKVVALNMYYPNKDNDDTIIWEGEFIEVLRNMDELSSINVYFRAPRSVDDELSETVAGDLPKFVIAILIMFAYSSVVISYLGWTRTRIWISIAGTISIILSIASSFGVASAVGATASSITLLLPFILIGIGLDDMFVLVDSIDRYKQEGILDPKILFPKAISDSGTSICLTSITNFCAFFLGAIASLPAVRGFAIYAGFGILFALLFQISFLSALISFDLRRETKNRCELCPCVFCPPKSDRIPKPSFIRIFLNRYYTPFLLNPRTKFAVILVFTTAVIVALVGATKLDTGLVQQDLAPDGSYLIDWLDRNDKYFGGITVTIYQVVTDTEFDYGIPSNQDLIRQVSNELNQKDYILSTDSWLDSFIDWLPTSPYNSSLENGRPPSNQFLPWLETFLALPTSIQYDKDVVIVNGKITSSRIRHERVGFVNQKPKVDAMKDSRKVVSDLNFPGFVWSRGDIFYEGDAIMVEEAILNLTMAATAILIVSLALMYHPGMACLVVLNIIMVDIELLGLMFITNINLNSISVVNLVMSIGLSFDYVGHIGHAFSESPQKNRNLRAANALNKLGVPVLNGAITTFLAVLVLSTSDSAIFRTFFIMFAGIVGFGILHGMMFMPVLLSLVAPYGLEENDITNIRSKSSLDGSRSSFENSQVVQLSIESSVSNVLRQLYQNTINYVQLKVDGASATMYIDHTDNIPENNIKKIKEKIQNEEIQFHLFGFNKKIQGETSTSYVLIISAPNEKMEKAKAYWSENRSRFEGRIDTQIELTEKEELSAELIQSKLSTKLRKLI